MTPRVVSGDGPPRDAMNPFADILLPVVGDPQHGADIAPGRLGGYVAKPEQMVD